jgi:hypothetical protein
MRAANASRAAPMQLLATVCSVNSYQMSPNREGVGLEFVTPYSVEYYLS